MHGFQPLCPVWEHFADISIESYWCFYCCLFLLPGMERTSMEWIKKKKKRKHKLLSFSSEGRATELSTEGPLCLWASHQRWLDLANTLILYQVSQASLAKGGRALTNANLNILSQNTGCKKFQRASPCPWWLTCNNFRGSGARCPSAEPSM